MKKYFKQTAIIILIFVVSCSKDDTPQEEQLPTGENTAYYYLDGQLIVPKSYTAGISHVKAIDANDCIPASNGFNLYLNNSGLSINIHLLDRSQTGTFVLNSNNYSFCGNTINIGLLSSQDSNNQWNYFVTKTSSGTVTIENLSPDNRKFSGTFQMDVYSNTNEVKHITNGHFNINLDTL